LGDNGPVRSSATMVRRSTSRSPADAGRGGAVVVVVVGAAVVVGASGTASVTAGPGRPDPPPPSSPPAASRAMAPATTSTLAAPTIPSRNPLTVQMMPRAASEAADEGPGGSVPAPAPSAPLPGAGNPDGNAEVPAEARAVDTSRSTAVLASALE
jgi:hypothetical protein